MFSILTDAARAMPADGWRTLGVLLTLFPLLIVTSLPVDMVFMGGLAVLLLLGVVDPSEAFAGFGSPALFTVGALYVVVAGLQETGALKGVSRRLPARVERPRRTLLGITAPVAFLSAFMNNTPVVALFIPVVQDWCRRHHVSTNRFLLPLGYAAILGGMCTLIGTSTNLVVHSLYLEHGGKGLGLFSVTRLGLPCALIGLAYLAAFSGRLPVRDRDANGARGVTSRRYTVELEVTGGNGVVGKTPGELLDAVGGGVRLLDRMRDGHGAPDGPEDEPLAAGDHLLLSGILGEIRHLRDMKGLRLTASRFFTPGAAEERQLVEAVVSHTCPLVGKTLQQGRFRQVYNAVVVAMARNGVAFRGSLKKIPLRAGDVLLVECHAGFIPRQVDSGDFYLLNALDETLLRTHARKAPLAIGILVVMLGVAALDQLSMLKAALFAAGAMLMTGCCSAAGARRKIDWTVLMVIGAALGLGAALQTSGAAHVLAEILRDLSGGHPWIALGLLYLNTAVFTEMITNNAAVALVFPIAMDTAAQLGVSPVPFVFCVMIAGSASFATPIGYQTNLMIFGSGNYRFSDYLRFGIPLGLLIGLAAVGLAPLMWPF